MTLVPINGYFAECGLASVESDIEVQMDRDIDTGFWIY